MFNFLNKLKTWLGFADINQDGKVDAEDLKIVSDVVKAETKKVVAAKKEAVAEVKTTVKKGAKKVVAAKKEAVAEVKATVKRGRPKKTD
jgi:hypothetical protein